MSQSIVTSRCPSWCRLWPGHGLATAAEEGREHIVQVGHLQTPRGRATVNLAAWETTTGRIDPPVVWVDEPALGLVLGSLTAGEAQELSGLLAAAAAQLEQVATISRRAGLTVLDGGRR